MVIAGNHTAEQAELPDTKRQKTQDMRPGIVQDRLFSTTCTTQLRQSFDSSIPYNHVIIQDVCAPDVLRAVRDEVINNIQATYKETDLFKVFQTGMQPGKQHCAAMAQYASSL